MSPRARRASLLTIALALAALTAPVAAEATVTIAPSPSYSGNYTVAWTDASGGGSIFRAYVTDRPGPSCTHGSVRL